MVARAGTSTRDFYEIFDSSQDCFLAAFEEGLGRLTATVEEATRHEQDLLGRIRTGLAALLGFLDEQPGWARLLFYPVPLENTAAVRCEQRLLGVLTVLLDDGSPQAIAETMSEPQLTSELVIGGVFSLLRTHIANPDNHPEALVGLAPCLLAFIIRPYIGHAGTAAQLGRPAAPTEHLPAQAVEFPLPSPVPVTRRTRLVLDAIASAPRSNNREIATAARIVDDGQISHLLQRLARRGLIVKVAPRSGSRRANAWLLTPSGQRVVELLGLAAPDATLPTCAGARVRQAA